MMKNLTAYQWMFSLLVAAFALHLMGCETAPRVGAESVTSPSPGGSMYLDHLLTNDPSLMKKLQIVRIDKTMAGNILKPTVTLGNLKKRPLRMNVKFAWFDQNGVEIRPEDQPWKPVSLIGYETKSIQAAAPSSAAQSFKFAIQEVK